MTVAVNGRFGSVQLSYQYQSDPETYVSKKPTASIFRDMKDLVNTKLKVVGSFETSGKQLTNHVAQQPGRTAASICYRAA